MARRFESRQMKACVVAGMSGANAGAGGRGLIAGFGRKCSKCLRINTHIFGRIGQEHLFRRYFQWVRLVSCLFR
jgi:hypothetical protein